MEINFENCQDSILVTYELENLIISATKYVFEVEQVDVDYEVNIFLVNNDMIKEANFENRGIDKETDCLSFPLLHYKKGKVFKTQYENFKFKDYDLNEGRLLLGDVLISLEKANSQSIEYDHSFNREVIYLLIHSLLHLIGYDHLDDEDKINMRNREKQIVKHLGIFK